MEERGGKIYLNKKILIKHDGASSVNKFESIELEKVEIGIGCGQLFTIIKNLKDIFSHLLSLFQNLFHLY